MKRSFSILTVLLVVAALAASALLVSFGTPLVSLLSLTVLGTTLFTLGVCGLEAAANRLPRLHVAVAGCAIIVTALALAAGKTSPETNFRVGAVGVAIICLFGLWAVSRREPAKNPAPPES